ncbi:Homoserine kinase [hydrothermal vent metagenome]|uniref:Homoserine kinase n=1 Tax=hydrothermal vent metagenome TaxID=652676 RepID=A0A3B0U7T1_9ZZZZ
MAVYTEVDDEALDAFVAGYDIGGVLSCKGIAEGVENTNYLLHTDAGHYILTLYEKRVAQRDLPFFLGLMEHLAAGGIACPVPVRPRNGTMPGELMGRPAALVTFLDGVWPKRPKPAHCRELGGALARMHLAAAGFELTRANALCVASWRGVFEQSGPRADEVMPGLYDWIAGELDDLEAGWPQGLPRGIIHADLFPDNVFFLGTQLSGIIDFYFACDEALAYDLAICLNAWCFEKGNEFNITKARALIAAYHAVRPLDDTELAALPLLARGAAMRFLLTRLYDWLNTPKTALVTPKDPMEYVHKLRFHRGIDGPGGYGIDG